MDPRLKSAAVAAAPRIAAALLHQDQPQVARELRRLKSLCGYVATRRALDNAVRCPEVLAHALASSAPKFAQALRERSAAERNAATVHFVQQLVAGGAKQGARAGLRRLPISDAVREAFVSAVPGAVLAAARKDARAARGVGTELVRELVHAKAVQNLRSGHSFKDRMQNAALLSAPAVAVAGIRNTKGDAAKAVLEFVGRAGVVTVDQVVDRFIRDNHEDLFAAQRSAKGFLKELVMHNWLQKREFVLPVARSIPGVLQAAKIPQPHLAFGAGMVAFHPVYRQAWQQVVYTTPRAASQFSVPLPPDLRQAFIPHYLRTMDACLALERRYESRGCTVTRIAGENELIRENFKGRVFRAGVVLPKFPDAQLTVRAPDGATHVVNVEYVTKSYTPAMIASKARAFTGPTVWAVDSYATAAKVRDVAGSDADLLLVN